MSTILDALRKVERERDGSPQQFDVPTITPPARRRRSFPVAAVAMCAVIGFSGGALLSWWMPEEVPIETAALPEPPPPPEIPVPRAPVRAQPKAEAPVVVADQRPATEPDAAAPAPGVVPPQAAPTPAAEAVAVAPGPPSSEPAERPPADVVIAKPVGPPPINAARPVQPERGPAEVLAALEKSGSALEPSPFGAVREQAREAAGLGDDAREQVAAREKSPVAPPMPPPAPREQEPQDLAAIAPAPPLEAPAVEENPAAEAEPEPETPAETLVDTGRSPPGAPKVALSFLQWSTDPAKRFAFVSIDGAPSQRVHEGEVAAGLTVAAITPNGVQFKREGTTFVIRPRH